MIVIDYYKQVRELEEKNQLVCELLAVPETDPEDMPPGILEYLDLLIYGKSSKKTPVGGK